MTEQERLPEQSSKIESLEGVHTVILLASACELIIEGLEPGQKPSLELDSGSPLSSEVRNQQVTISGSSDESRNAPPGLVIGGRFSGSMLGGGLSIVGGVIGSGSFPDEFVSSLRVGAGESWPKAVLRLPGKTRIKICIGLSVLEIEVPPYYTIQEKILILKEKIEEKKLLIQQKANQKRAQGIEKRMAKRAKAEDKREQARQAQEEAGEAQRRGKFEKAREKQEKKHEKLRAAEQYEREAEEAYREKLQEADEVEKQGAGRISELEAQLALLIAEQRVVR